MRDNLVHLDSERSAAVEAGKVAYKREKSKAAELLDQQ
jgi:hypothetical protein